MSKAVTTKPAKVANGIAYASRRTHQLRRVIKAYLDDGDRQFVLNAMDFAIKAHDGQKRLSGKPYIEHPLATAMVLAEMRQDATTLAGALLHDVVEDCGVTVEELDQKFSPTVGKLVQSVTNLNQLDYADMAQAAEDDKYKQTKLFQRPPEHLREVKAYNLRKMFIAMAWDARVVLVKLADRLHNMNTLRYLPPERQLRMARETLDIYAPIAHRLGVATIKWQLEDLAFKYLFPDDYKRVTRIVSRRRNDREDYTQRAHEQIRTALEKKRIKCTVSSRPKHLYSIYNKMQRYAMQGKQYSEIYDYVALRIVTDSNRLHDCYRVLEIVHGLWKPIPYQFDDYIANPKENFYQSLHTSVIGPDNYPLEVQIRTQEMHRLAEDGIAAHWSYKEGGKQARKRSDEMHEKAIANLKANLIEAEGEHAEGADEYVAKVRNDYLSGQVFVFTPRGSVIELPNGSTPLDFAYKIHTELGHRCRGSKVNGRLVPLSYELRNGDIVEIVRSKTPQSPKLDWLNPELGFLRSDSARTKVKAWFRKQKRQAHIDTGRAILEREHKRLGVKLSRDEIAHKLNFADAHDLEQSLGSGQIAIERVLEQIIPEVFGHKDHPKTTKAQPERKITTADIVVLGTDNLYTRIARCCADLSYGEAILGYITQSKGISIHKSDCRSVRSASEPARLVNATWGHSTNSYPATLSITAKNRIGFIRDITTILADENANVGEMYTAGEVPDMKITLTLYTASVHGLTRIINRFRMVEGLVKITNGTVGQMEQSANGHPKSPNKRTKKRAK